RLALRFVDDDLDDADALGLVERGALAGGAARAEKVDARIDLPAREPPHAGFIERAARRERRDQRGSDSGKRRSHDLTPSTSAIVNQPRLPWIHCAATRAPRANAVRSRAACVSVIVSAGPSNPTVWVPGMNPARVAETSIGRVNPDRSIAPFRSSAVPDGASFFAA